MDDSNEKVVPVDGVLGKEVDPVNEVLGLPSTQDLWDALSMKVSDKSHIIPVISQEMLAKRGLEGMSLFSVTADGQVCIDGVPEAEYFKQNHMEFLDMWYIRTFYGILLDKFRDAIRSGMEINSKNVMDFTARLSVNDLMNSYSTGNFTKLTKERLIKNISLYSGVAGVLPSMFKAGGWDVFPVLVWEGTLADGTFFVKSPYLNFLMQHSLVQSFRWKNRHEILRDGQGRALMAPNTSYLFKSSINNGKLGIARDFAYVICQVIEAAGSHPNHPPHITAREIIRRVPEFECRLNCATSTANRNTTLKRTFLKTWEILREHTILTQRYKDIDIPNSYPTMSNLDMVFTFHHGGKIKSKDAEAIQNG